MAPIGVQSLAHADKESGLAKACADVNIPYIMSTTSSSTFQQVAAGNGNGKRWYQLYWPNDNEVTLSLLQRARDHGFQVLVVTLDIWKQAW
jgi:isopentenyl diphosphate isomerase/L-lactate dehydrogenase-like FMN-dependent dehydrogenase